VTIRASSGKQINALVADLSSGNAVALDAAVARLTVIGSRAVARLLAVAESGSDATAQVAALRALEAIGDPRALDPALHVMNTADAAAATAAVRVALAFVRGPRSPSAVDGLAAVALNPSRPEAVRVAAVQALRQLEASTIAPLLASLGADKNAAVRAEADAGSDRAPRRPQDHAGGVLRGAAGKSLPDDPATLRRTLGREGGGVPLPDLLRLVERVREREATEPAAKRAEWMTVRAAAHLALAQRDSRLALYDIRESLEAAAAPLPVDMLAALSLVGDQSCLEAMAGAYARSKDSWWRDRLADTFRTIAARERLTRRHAIVKRIEKRWKGVGEDLWTARAGRAGKPGSALAGEPGKSGS
jgi:hypothetical protein